MVLLELQVNSFNEVEPKITGLADLSDGAVLAKLLATFAPQSFIDLDSASDPTDKVHNVRQLFVRIGEFYEDVVGRMIEPDFVNATALARDEVTQCVPPLHV